jgi:hypothetical protein
MLSVSGCTPAWVLGMLCNSCSILSFKISLYTFFEALSLSSFLFNCSFSAYFCSFYCFLMLT